MDPLHDLCLTCLSKPRLAHNLNDIILENFKILEILKKLVPSIMENHELPLPNCICNHCVDKLVSAYTFQKQCLASVENLYQMWKENFKEKVVKQEVEELDLNKNEQTGEEEIPTATLNDNDKVMENLFEEITMDSLTIDKEDSTMDFTKISKDSVAESESEGEMIFENSENEENESRDKLKNNYEEGNTNQCKLCKKVFKLPKSLASHMAQAHLHRSLYQCEKCHRGFNMKEAYEAHCNSHEGLKSFKCEQCDKAFVSRTTLKQHLICHSNDTPFSCTICNRSFNRSSTLTQHLQRHNTERPYKCKICSKTFKCISDYSKHRSLHAKKRYRCKFCDSLFFTKELLQQHQKLKHDGDKPFKCSQCDRTFRTRTHKKSHQRTHTEERPFPCELCDEDYFEISELKIHMRRKHKKKYDGENEDGVNIIDLEDESSEEMNTRDSLNKYQDFDLGTSEKPAKNVENTSKDNLTDNAISDEQIVSESSIDNKDDLKILLSENINNEVGQEILPTNELQKCKLCNKTFKLAHGLNLHMATKHFRNHPYKCEFCSRGFIEEEYYIKHRNRHLGIKTFKCSECGKGFDSNSTLNQHLISHSKETPYLCPTCGKSFNRSGTLRQHILRHGDATPFQCSECSKKFKCHSDLLCHMKKIHKGGTVYDCEICGKRFTNSTSIVHHKRVHSGEKPYKCDLCDRSFNSSSNMKCHRRIHTGEKPYDCPYCEKSFRQSYDCKKHAMRMHPKEVAAAKGELKKKEEK